MSRPRFTRLAPLEAAIVISLGLGGDLHGVAQLAAAIDPLMATAEGAPSMVTR